MRRLSIDAFDYQDKYICTTVVDHIDICRSGTILIKDKKITPLYEPLHFINISDGIVSIYYKSGFSIKIKKI